MEKRGEENTYPSSTRSHPALLFVTCGFVAFEETEEMENEKEREEIRALFNELDVDKDGKISLSDFMFALQKKGIAPQVHTPWLIINVKILR